MHKIRPLRARALRAETLETEKTKKDKVVGPPPISVRGAVVLPIAGEPASPATDGTGANLVLRTKKPASAGLLDRKRVLHVGSGVRLPKNLHAIFKNHHWQEIRCDIDESTKPDIIASIADLGRNVENASCDAIWASHVLEHLSRHQVPLALREFRRVLTPTGFVLIRLPDLEQVAQLIVEGRINDVIYTSAAGPITPLDMLYGHDASITRGHQSMRHGTGFTEDLLAQDMVAAGFAEVRTARTKTYEVWAAAFMQDANVEILLDELARSGADLRC
jgi:SAM-dependent methyltransferase